MKQIYITTRLRNTARAWGLQTSYTNNEGVCVWAPEKTLKKVLADLTQLPAQSEPELIALFEKKRFTQIQSGLEASHVLWQGQNKKIYFYTDNLQPLELKISLELESSESRSGFAPAQALQQNDAYTITDIRQRTTQMGSQKVAYQRVQVELKNNWPLGYHRLTVVNHQQKASSLLISAPQSLQARPELKKSWGPFIPLYSVRTGQEWGMGSFKELREASQVCARFGAKWFSTLPLLAANFDHADCDPSPYSALTRLFWNEIYLDVEALAHKYKHADALEKINSAEFQAQLQELRQNRYVDYYKVYQTKKTILKILSEDFFKNAGAQSSEYKKFVRENPEIDAYAAFRSQDLSEQNFHRFVQFEMFQELSHLASENPLGLYMDFPVGVNDAGFDFKHFNSVFFKEVSVGAPPEPVFQQGQDWGFPSFHALRHRAEGYAYFRKCLQRHLRFCKILRLDHVMGLYRIYAVPKGFTGKEGIYLRFSPEDLFAIVILEAHRAGADFVGENLGTVPAAVDHTIQTRNLNGMWVLQMGLAQNPEAALASIPTQSMQSFNTHDMPMWACYQKGDDLALVRDLKILGSEYYEPFLKDRHQQIEQWKNFFQKDLTVGGDSLTVKLHEKMAQSKAKYFVVTIEDLWGEEAPQNIPGTWKEYPNWRRKMALPLPEWQKHPQAAAILKILSVERK